MIISRTASPRVWSVIHYVRGYFFSDRVVTNGINIYRYSQFKLLMSAIRTSCLKMMIIIKRLLQVVSYNWRQNYSTDNSHLISCTIYWLLHLFYYCTHGCVCQLDIKENDDDDDDGDGLMKTDLLRIWLRYTKYLTTRVDSKPIFLACPRGHSLNFYKPSAKMQNDISLEQNNRRMEQIVTVMSLIHH